MQRKKLEPIFSIVIPTYNRAERLKICLESLAKQTFTSFEVLVCDDGSTDNTNEVIKQFSDKLDLTYLWEPNFGGPAKPRNNGIDKAKGEWICFLDSDDWWYENKLKLVYEYSLKYPHIDVISHDLMLNDLKLVKRYLLPSGPVVPNLYIELLKYGNRFPNSANSIRKSSIDKYGTRFCESKRLISVEDYDFCLQLALVNLNFGCINLPLGEYIIESDNISNFDLHFKNLEALLKKHVLEIQNFESDKQKLWKEVFSRFNILKGTASFKKCDYLNAIWFFLLSIKSSPTNFSKYIVNRLRLTMKRMRVR